MKYSEVARRYAHALYDLAAESGAQNKMLEQLRGLKKVFLDDKTTREFLTSPLTKASDRQQTLIKALESGGVLEDVKKLVLLLAQKNRLGFFGEIVLAFQDRADQAGGVTRGTVRSAHVLSEDERKQVETMVKKATGKNVILNYKEDASVIGGLIAQVGSYTFDDTIGSHLRRMKEELNRKTL